MKIESIKVGRRDKEKLVIRTEEGEYISACVDDALNLRVGDEITAEKAEELSSRYAKTLAKKSAAKTLARRSMSEGELTKKLRDKGFSDADTAEAVSWFSEHGFVDDAAYTDELVRYYISRGCGKRRIKEELYRRGISRELCERATEALPDFTDEIRSLIEKKLHGEELTPDKKKKIVAFLIRRGFEYDEIRVAFETEDFD